MNFYYRHIGDYLKHTGHLSLTEHGVLNLLLDRFYGTEKPITRQEAFGLCRPGTKAERQAVESVLTEFFIETKSGYVNRRAVREIEKYQEKSEKAKQAIRTRWDKKAAENQQKADADVIRTYNERNTIPVTNNQYPISSNQYPKSNIQKGNLIPIGELLAERFKKT